MSKSVRLWVGNQRPCVQGCTELIADPSSVAHLKKKKHPHQKKAPAERIFKVQRCTVLTEKAYLSLKHASNPQPTMNAYKRWSWKQKGPERERWMDGWNRLVSFAFQSPAFHARAVCLLSATHLYSLFFDLKARVPLPMRNIMWEKHVFFSPAMSWKPESSNLVQEK